MVRKKGGLLDAVMIFPYFVRCSLKGGGAKPPKIPKPNGGKEFHHA